MYCTTALVSMVTTDLSTHIQVCPSHAQYMLQLLCSEYRTSWPTQYGQKVTFPGQLHGIEQRICNARAHDFHTRALSLFYITTQQPHKYDLYHIARDLGRSVVNMTFSYVDHRQVTQADYCTAQRVPRYA